MGQKVVLWFGEGQKYQFLYCPLPPVCHVPETVLQIKHWTTGVVLSCLSFFSKSNACLRVWRERSFDSYKSALFASLERKGGKSLQKGRTK